MKSVKLILLTILFLVLSVGVVNAESYPFLVQKTHDVTPVNPGDTFTYNIQVTNPYDITFHEAGIFDTLPDEVEFVSCSSCCNDDNAPMIEWEGICQAHMGPGEIFYRTITVRLKSDTAGKTFCNHVLAGGALGDNYEDNPIVEAEDCITISEAPVPTPEFPSAFLPATMIIGFLGAVLLIQRTKEK